jgi:hypothetical protein
MKLDSSRRRRRRTRGTPQDGNRLHHFLLGISLPGYSKVGVSDEGKLREGELESGWMDYSSYSMISAF